VGRAISMKSLPVRPRIPSWSFSALIGHGYRQCTKITHEGRQAGRQGRAGQGRAGQGRQAHAGRQEGRQTGRQVKGEQVDIHVERTSTCKEITARTQKGRQAHAGRQAGRQVDRSTGKPVDIHVERTSTCKEITSRTQAGRETGLHTGR
jgi:hypothetical protein